MPSTGRRVLADVNVWLATLVEQHPHHTHAIEWWQTEVLPQRRTACFCRVTQLGLLRLLTNAAIMGPSRKTCEQAWSHYDRLLEQPVVEYIDEPSGLTDRLRGHTRGQDPSASLWTDAYLASFAQTADLELATFDRGFRRFSGVQLKTLG
ncbi:MAG: TA system VapC family ribonuclease toxin [Acidobacteriota bacterium]